MALQQAGPMCFRFLPVVALVLPLPTDTAIDDCFHDDFTETMCCSSRWGIVGNPACWSAEYTYLRCCGLASLPRHIDDDAAWDEDIQTNHPIAAEEYDFIVVGAGSAGSVVASRLAAADGPDGKPWRVLLLEDGQTLAAERDTADPDRPLADPGVWRRSLNVTWKAEGGEIRRWTYPTGRVIGGTGALNSMIYMRGSVSEYENLIGWSMADVLDAFRLLEAPMEVPGFEVNADYHRHMNETVDYDQNGYHMSLVSATRGELPSLFRSILDAFESAGVPFRLDPHSRPSMHGVGGIWRTMGCDHARCQPSRVPRFRDAMGRPRSSTARTMLSPTQLRRRQRLTVSTDAIVERVIVDGAKRAVGVEAVLDIGSDAAGSSSANGRQRKRIFYRATREVVLSAGVFGSPKILTHSGIAEPQELLRLGIPLVASSPQVGLNLHEHVGASVVVGTNVQCPEGFHLGEGARTTHLGNTDEFIAQFYAFFNSSRELRDSHFGPVEAEVMLLEGCVEGTLSLTFTIMLLLSNTRGRIAVTSRNPSTPVHVDYKPLGHSGDIDLFANVLRRLYISVLASPALDNYDLTVSPSFEVIADMQKLLKWLRQSLWYYSHPGGTVSVKREGEPGVLDREFRVEGVHGLRVADASVFPQSPSGHFDGPSRLVGELAARCILRHWLPKRRSNLDGLSGKSFVTLHSVNDVRIPFSGYGTNGLEGNSAAEMVARFLGLGGRLIDTAVLYNNHRDISRGLGLSLIPRVDVTIVTKIPPGDMGYEATWFLIEKTVDELGTYIDILLIHWPANFDPSAPSPECARGEGSWRACRADTWRAMEDAVKAGKVRALGVSNFGVRHLRELLDEPGRTQPVSANEVEFHPWWPQPDLLEFCRRKRITLIAYGSTGSSLTGGAMLRTPQVAGVARRAMCSPAQVLLRWAVQQGVVVIPSSSSHVHMTENLNVTSWSLTEDDMAQLNAVRRGDWARNYMPDPEIAP